MPIINEIHAFIATEEDGGEGVIAHSTVIAGEKYLIPLVCADKKRIDSSRPIAEKIAREANIQVKLVKFSVREEVEVIYEPVKN